MIDDYQQMMSAYLISLPDKSKMLRPMSRKARKLLIVMLEWSKQYHMKLWNPKGTSGFMADFYSLYHPIRYEEICHRFNVDQYLSLLNKKQTGVIPGPFKTKEAVLNAMMLKHFDSYEWVKDSALNDNGRKIGSVESLGVISSYEWLTEHFILTDFIEEDLSRIIMLGDEKFDFDIVKREAVKIQEASKRSMAYLYAIVKDITIKEEAMRKKQEAVSSVYHDRLHGILATAAEAQNKLIHSFPDDIEGRWATDLRFLEATIDIKH